MTSSVRPRLQSSDQDPIVALCSPQGSGAVALLRISGDGALDVASMFALLSSKTKLCDAPTHTIHHGFVVDDKNNGERIDEVLFFVMRAPKTFTGLDTVEITCHNNPFIIERIILLAIAHGARLAKPGEFTKRSFLSGKIDLLQAEAINDVIHAQSQLALQKSMSHLRGTLSSHLADIETELVALLGFVEASFEFLDEEQRDFSFNDVIIKKASVLLDLIKKIGADFSLQQQIKQGMRIAIVGPVNAGKSTLFNALVGKKRAIVTDIEGTTRDSIEANVYKDGNFLLFVDTAGLRATTDIIEQQGIYRSWQEATEADIVLMVVDATRLDENLRKVYSEFIKKYEKKLIVVVNKIDAVHDRKEVDNFLGLQELQIVYTSAKDLEGIGELEAKIEREIQRIFATMQSPYLLNQRQHRILAEIEAKLDFVVKGFSHGIHYELIAYELKDILEKAAELTGRNITEAVLDMVFNSFCVGK